MRILGLDVGTKRIGVALSDPLGMMAFPLIVVVRKSEKEDLEAIAGLVQQHGVERIVVGLPRSLDGSLGKETQRVEVFRQKLSQKVAVPLESWDERLSTVAAEKSMIQMGKKREERKTQRDALAAAYILQGYLDRVRNLQP